MNQDKALMEINIQRIYHVVFSTYRREPLLSEPYRTVVRQLIKQICLIKKIKLITYKVLTDHVHLLIKKKPKQFMPALMQYIKGITTYQFYAAHPNFTTSYGKRRLWNRGYNETQIQSTTQLHNTIRYIQNNYDKYQDSSGAPGFTPVGELVAGWHHGSTPHLSVSRAFQAEIAQLCTNNVASTDQPIAIGPSPGFPRSATPPRRSATGLNPAPPINT